MKADLAEIIEVAAWSGVGIQLDLGLPPAIDPKDEIARAKQAGMTAGMEAKDCKPPYEASSDPGQAWIAAWHEGQAINAGKIKPTEPAAGSAETKGGLDLSDIGEEEESNLSADAQADAKPTDEEIAKARADWNDSMRANIKAGEDTMRKGREDEIEDIPAALDRRHELVGA